MMVHSFGDALETYNNYALYLRKNGIFIEGRLREKFYDFEKLIKEALVEQNTNLQQQHNQLRPWNSEKCIALEKGESRLNDLQQEVQGRLWNADLNA
jgi:hypothetical protein